MSNVSIDSNLATTWKNIEMNMQSTLLNYTLACADNFNLRTAVFGKFPIQSVLIANHLKWSNLMYTLKSVKNVLRSNDDILQDFNVCCDIIKSDNARNEIKERACYVAISIMNYRDLFKCLQHYSIKAANILLSSRSRWHFDERTLRISVLQNSIDYGFEYYGQSMDIIDGPLTDRFTISLWSAISQQRCLMLIGHDFNHLADRNTKHLSTYFGKLFLTYDFHNDIIPSIKRAIQAAQVSNAWMKICINRESDMLSFIGLCNEACFGVVHNDKVDLKVNENNAIPLSSNWFLFLNYGVACSTLHPRLDIDLKASFRTIAIRNIDLNCTYKQLRHFQILNEDVNTLSLVPMCHTFDIEKESIERRIFLYLGRDREINVEQYKLTIENNNLKRLLSTKDTIKEALNAKKIIAVFDEVCKLLDIKPTSFLENICIKILENIKYNNGLILYGEVGYGKTLVITTCAQIINEIMRQKHKEYVEIVQLQFFDEDFRHKKLEDAVDINTLVSTINTNKNKPMSWYHFDGHLNSEILDSLQKLFGSSDGFSYGDLQICNVREDDRLIFENDTLKDFHPSLLRFCSIVYLSNPTLNADIYIDKIIETSTILWQIEEQRARQSVNDILLPIYKEIRNKILKRCNSLEFYMLQNFVKYLEAFFNRMMDQKAVGAIIRLSDLFEASFVYCLAWSIHIFLRNSTEEEIYGKLLRDLFQLNQFAPNVDAFSNIYSLYLDYESFEWKEWNSTIFNEVDRPLTSEDSIFCESTIPSLYFTQVLTRNKNSILLFGPEASGKTQILRSLRTTLKSTIRYMSVGPLTSVNDFREYILRNYLIKRSNRKYGSLKGVPLTVLVDDVHMAARSISNQCALHDCLRLLIQEYPWYTATSEKIQLENVVFGCAMTTDWNSLNHRVTNKFAAVRTRQFTTDEQMKILNYKLSKWINLEFQPNSICNELSTILLQIHKDLSVKIWNSFSIPFHFAIKTCNILSYSPMMEDVEDIAEQCWFAACHVYGDLSDNQTKRQQKITDAIQSVLNIKDTAIFSQHVCTQTLNHENPNLLKFKIYENVDYLRSDLHGASRQFDNINESMLSITCADQILHYSARLISSLSDRNHSTLIVGSSGSGRKTLSRFVSHILNLDMYQINVTSTMSIRELCDIVKDYIISNFVQNKQISIMIELDRVETNTRHTFVDFLSSIYNNVKSPGYYSHSELESIQEKCRRNLFIDGDNFQLLERYAKYVKSSVHIVVTVSQNIYKQTLLRNYKALLQFNICQFYDWSTETLISMTDSLMSSLPIESTSTTSLMTEKLPKIHKTSIKIYNYIWPNNDHVLKSTRFVYFLRNFASLSIKQTNDYQAYASTLISASQQISKLQNRLNELNEIINELEPQLKNLRAIAYKMQAIVNKESKDLEKYEDELKADESQIEDLKIQIEQRNLSVQLKLNTVIPPLDSAQAALNFISRNDLSEIRTIISPPPQISMVMTAICALLNVQPIKVKGVMSMHPGARTERYWEASKRLLENPNFIQTLRNFNKDNVTPDTINQLESYMHSDHVKVTETSKVYEICNSLGNWVKCIYNYFFVKKVIDPINEEINYLLHKLEIYIQSADMKREKLVKLKSELKHSTDAAEKSNNDSKMMEDKMNSAVKNGREIEK
ncbi:hypothetical protein GJ496_007857, partial [Pomphorhynchus laevis]